MYDSRSVRRYQETDVVSMSREKMIAALYEKMITCYRQAEEALEGGDRLTMNARVSRAQRIVTELRHALDHNIGGDITRNLESIYDYIFHENLHVLLDGDAGHLRNCRRVLTPLHAAWSQIPPGSAERAEAQSAEGTAHPGADDAGAGSPAVPSEETRPSVAAPGIGRSGLLSISA